MISRVGYENLVYTLPVLYPSIRMSTLVLAPPGLDIARLTGLVTFGDDIVLCVYELIDFQAGEIQSYRYEVSRCDPPFSERPLPDAQEYCRTSYSKKTKLYWYDSWPHPNDPNLFPTHPHHKHVSPDIKHHRIPAPGLSFIQPNLPLLIEEIQQTYLGMR